MKLIAALEILGLAESVLSRDSIMQAYRSAVRAAHPDTAGQSGVALRELQQARDVLLAVNDEQESSCLLCDGAGRVQGVMGLRRCDACAGTGDRR